MADVGTFRMVVVLLVTHITVAYIGYLVGVVEGQLTWHDHHFRELRLGRQYSMGDSDDDD